MFYWKMVIGSQTTYFKALSSSSYERILYNMATGNDTFLCSHYRANNVDVKGLIEEAMDSKCYRSSDVNEWSRAKMLHQRLSNTIKNVA